MKETQETLDRLVQLAKKAPAAPEPEMPFGFATRVVARWQSAPASSPWTVWEMFSRRILAVSCAVMFLSLVFGYESLREGLSDNWTTASSGALEIDLP